MQMRAGLIRVLVADDSVVMRSAIQRVFAEDAALGCTAYGLKLCGVVRDGLELVNAVAMLKPDLLVVDLEMPRLGGGAAVARLRREGFEGPVILVSGQTAEDARLTLEALHLGAQDYVMKPVRQQDERAWLRVLSEELLPRIVAHGSRSKEACSLLRAESALANMSMMPCAGLARQDVRVVVMAASTGGPAALEAVLSGLPKGLRAPVIVAQHMPKLFTTALLERLRRSCAMAVHLACDGSTLLPGSIWVAPGGCHLELSLGVRLERGERDCVSRLHPGPVVRGCQPAADLLFGSAARALGGGVLAVMLTGMGQDGLEGARAVHGAGGTVLVQDEASSAVWGMPGAVAKAGLATQVIALQGMAREICRRVEPFRTAGESRGATLTRRGTTLDRRMEVTHGVL